MMVLRRFGEWTRDSIESDGMLQYVEGSKYKACSVLGRGSGKEGIDKFSD